MTNGQDEAGSDRDRIAFTVRLDRALHADLVADCAALAVELKVPLSQNDFWERMAREHLAARRAAVAAPAARRRA